ncbi:MFS transporter [Runella aurantiaca]|uniref:MFS transporter n=1 Tax=Runella aurantiaca TaxID=2282308 RepID=A0A369I6J1_9BACT|nr:MFS transporter [Runella aurantiaca]RDB04510.1 MFS transporter [Runella aurantiaca]
MKRPYYLLPLVVVAQFAGTSLWFAVNAVMQTLQAFHPQTSAFMPTMTTAVQLGFVLGTLFYSYFSIADRFSPVRVFMISAALAASCNLTVLVSYQSLEGLFLARLGVGFFLAGVYPVGMKICSDWYETGLGKALGYLVGALVLGTAFPYILKSFSLSLPWQYVITVTSGLAVLGGIVIGLFVKDGPFRRVAGRFNPAVLRDVFKDKAFRRSAFGYFGHMFELYTFWAFVPVLITSYNQLANQNLSVPLFAFGIIASGALGCVLTGELSLRWGSHQTAWFSLLISCICCGLCVFLPVYSVFFFLVFMFIWGVSVVGDSPQFSTLVSQNAPSNYRATALTLVTSIGFFITIPSLYLTQWLFNAYGHFALVVLGLGGIVGLAASRRI